MRKNFSKKFGNIPKLLNNIQPYTLSTPFYCSIKCIDPHKHDIYTKNLMSRQYRNQPDIETGTGVVNNNTDNTQCHKF